MQKRSMNDWGLADWILNTVAAVVLAVLLYLVLVPQIQ